MTSRRWVLGGAMAVAGAIAALLIREVIATVFFAVTVAYVLGPLRRRLRHRGLSRRLAAVATSLIAFLAAVVVLAPLLVVLVVRLDAAVAFIESVPETATVSIAGFEYVVVTEEVTALLVEWLISAGTAVAAAAPVLLIKLALFAFVVYGLLHHEQRTRRAILALVPPEHREVAEALNERISRTLYGLYVVQVVTGFATFLVAIPVFVAFGYASPVALATLAGVLQFIPVIGPSVLIVGLTGYELLLGDPVAAAGILLVGGTAIAAAPDLLIRPRLATEAAELPGTLYFIGFVGGILTVGPIGIIAGPLVVAVVAELAAQLSAELNRIRVTEE
ncbi:AI-2E family transporter [Halorubrum luteum]